CGWPFGRHSRSRSRHSLSRSRHSSFQPPAPAASGRGRFHASGDEPAAQAGRLSRSDPIPAGGDSSRPGPPNSRPSGSPYGRSGKRGEGIGARGSAIGVMPGGGGGGADTGRPWVDRGSLWPAPAGETGAGGDDVVGG